MVHTKLQCIPVTLAADGTHQTTVYTLFTSSRWYTPDHSVYLAHRQQMVHTRLQFVPGTLVADGTHQTAVCTCQTGIRWNTADYSVNIAN